MSTMAQYIREKRKAVGLSQKEFAERVEVAQGTISAWETGKQLPREGNLVLVSRALSGADGGWERTLQELRELRKETTSSPERSGIPKEGQFYEWLDAEIQSRLSEKGEVTVVLLNPNQEALCRELQRSDASWHKAENLRFVVVWLLDLLDPGTVLSNAYFYAEFAKGAGRDDKVLHVGIRIFDGLPQCDEVQNFLLAKKENIPGNTWELLLSVPHDLKRRLVRAESDVANVSIVLHSTIWVRPLVWVRVVASSGITVGKGVETFHLINDKQTHELRCAVEELLALTPKTSE